MLRSPACNGHSQALIAPAVQRVVGVHPRRCLAAALLIGDAQGMLPIQGGIAQRNQRPVQCLQPPDGRFGGERIIGGEKECLEAGVLNRRRGSEAACAVLRSDIGTQIRHRFAPPFRTAFAGHECRHVGERDEAGADDDHLDTSPRIGLGDPLAAQLAEAIGIGRAQRMCLVDRQIVRRQVRIAVIQPEYRTA